MPVIQGKDVGPIGYGLMSLTSPGRPEDDEKAFTAIKTAIEAGCTYLNGGDFYGPPQRNSLVLLNRYFERYPEDADKILLNVKSCARLEPRRIDCSPQYVTECVENCVRQIGSKGFIHQFEPARRDKNTPLEDTIGTLRDLVAEGKIGGVALSEVNADTIRKAAAITKIVAVEVELSLWETGVLTNGVAKACKDLDIPIIAYGNLSHGLLSGGLNSPDQLGEKDYRKIFPRFQEGNFNKNLAIVNEVKRLADEKGCTQAQLALAWVLAVGRRPDMPVIVPIPGAYSPERIKENAGAAEIVLTQEDMDAIDGVVKKVGVAGNRYHDWGMDTLDT